MRLNKTLGENNNDKAIESGTRTILCVSSGSLKWGVRIEEVKKRFLDYKLSRYYEFLFFLTSVYY